MSEPTTTTETAWDAAFNPQSPPAPPTADTDAEADGQPVVQTLDSGESEVTDLDEHQDGDPVEPADELDDLSPDDYATAAAELAQEAVRAQQDDAGEPGSQREARYRIRLRETETQNAALLGQLDAMRRAEVVRLAGEKLVDGRDLLREGQSLDEVLAADGTVDPAKVAELAAERIRDRPHYGLPGMKSPNQFQSGAVGAAKPRPGWQDAFTPANQE
jgi:hypothetical protein